MKPTLPKGMRDFGPHQMARRHYIFNAIREVFRTFGFEPIETPAMENLSTLMGKYGDEGDQLLFKVLNSGDYLKSVPNNVLAAKDTKAALPDMAEKGLRYDLTVPFARYVVMNKTQLVFPFKRYQIQPVWRADRPQRGRYREFYQCDADVIGTNSLLCEAEILAMIKKVFFTLAIPGYVIKINHRDVLAGIARCVGAYDTARFFTIMDKLDKVGQEQVTRELISIGFTPAQCDSLFEILTYPADDKINRLRRQFENQTEGKRGLDELEEVLRMAEVLSSDGNAHIAFDPTLARGLSYYTGCIFEVKIESLAMGSVSGGGRYDGLTAVFDPKEQNSGVGISFGIDRIYDVMDELNLFPSQTHTASRGLICYFDRACMIRALALAASLRQRGIAIEVYPDASKIQKQLEYAHKKGIPYAVIIGEEEMKTELYTVKQMSTGRQENLSAAALVEKFIEQNTL